MNQLGTRGGKGEGEREKEPWRTLHMGGVLIKSPFPVSPESPSVPLQTPADSLHANRDHDLHRESFFLSSPDVWFESKLSPASKRKGTFISSTYICNFSSVNMQFVISQFFMIIYCSSSVPITSYFQTRDYTAGNSISGNYASTKLVYSNSFLLKTWTHTYMSPCLHAATVYRLSNLETGAKFSQEMYAWESPLTLGILSSFFFFLLNRGFCTRKGASAPSHQCESENSTYKPRGYSPPYRSPCSGVVVRLDCLHLRSFYANTEGSGALIFI